MSRLTALQVMQDAPVIPVIVLNDVAHAVPMARALVAGGIRMLEVTLRTPQALACIEAIAKAVPQAVVGAGTVRSRADAQAAANAGARFAVSPGYTSAVGQACRASRPTNQLAECLNFSNAAGIETQNHRKSAFPVVLA